MRYSSAFWATWRGSRVYGLPVVGSLTLQMTESVGTSVNGSGRALAGSGIRIMSLSSIAWNPRMLLPSKPIPRLNVFSSIWLAGIVACCQVPGMSTNLKSTILMPWSLM